MKISTDLDYTQRYFTYCCCGYRQGCLWPTATSPLGGKDPSPPGSSPPQPPPLKVCTPCHPKHLCISASTWCLALSGTRYWVCGTVWLSLGTGYSTVCCPAQLPILTTGSSCYLVEPQTTWRWLRFSKPFRVLASRAVCPD